MSSREDVFKAKIALQDSIRVEKDPKKKKAMQRRFDKMRIPPAVTHKEKEQDRNQTMRDKLGVGGGIKQSVKERQATLDSLRKNK